MKRSAIALLAAFCLAAGAETLINKPALDGKYAAGAWSVPAIKSELVKERNKVTLKVIENNNSKHPTNGQLMFPWNANFIAGNHYRLDFTIKASCDWKADARILLSKAPYTTLSTYVFDLKKDQPRKVSMFINATENIKGLYRLPCICYGTLPAGNTIEVSDIKLVQIN